MNNQWFSKVAVWLVIALVLFTVFKQFDTRGGGATGTLGYSDFLEEVRSNRIKSAVIQEGPSGTEIVAVTTDDRKVRTTATYLDRGLVGDLINNGVKFDVKPREEGSLLMTLLVSWGPMLLLIGVWIYFMRQMQGGGKGGAFSFGKSKARMLDENNNQVTFADVAGCDEAKEEVKEVVDFLKDPQKFQKLGGRIPRGLLLVGPPGTGKTLLAKGIAGEAKVPFFSISGSDFVEMFVGVGAARVRDMFENAKKNAPCIIFIDEIDAVGRQRGAGLGGGSADGAFMLQMLNKSFSLGITAEKLIDYAAVLGSDCPFFIRNKPVFATGRGEIMSEIKLNLKGLSLVLVKPAVEVATAAAFRNIIPQKPEISLSELIQLPVTEWKGNIANQFEISVFKQYPEIEWVKNQLYDQGAIYASMSGSGSCVFALFIELPENIERLFPSSYLTFSQQI